jgi:hypothetical protein
MKQHISTAVTCDDQLVERQIMKQGGKEREIQRREVEMGKV